MTRSAEQARLEQATFDPLPPRTLAPARAAYREKLDLVWRYANAHGSDTAAVYRELARLVK